jgi:hypothetical protein
MIRASSQPLVTCRSDAEAYGPPVVVKVKAIVVDLELLEKIADCLGQVVKGVLI